MMISVFVHAGVFLTSSTAADSLSGYASSLKLVEYFLLGSF